MHDHSKEKCSMNAGVAELNESSVWRRKIASLAPLMMLVLVSGFGCNGVHVYNAEKDELAQKAVTQFEALKLSDLTTEEVKASEELIEEEIAVIRRQSIARRNRLISAIVGGEDADTSWGYLHAYADRRLEDLIGDNPPGLSEWVAAPKTARDHLVALRNTQFAYNSKAGRSVPHLTRIGARLNRKQVGQLPASNKAIYDTYLDELEEYETALTLMTYPPKAISGRVSAVAQAWTLQAKVIREAKASAGEGRQKLVKLQNERKQKLEEARKPGKTADEISVLLKEAAEKTEDAKKILDRMASLSADQGLEAVTSKIVALEELRAELDDLLPVAAKAAIGEAPEDPAASTQLRLLASLAAVRAGIDAAAYPRVSDLILESERIRIELERLQAIVKLEEEKLDLYGLQLGALGREVAALSVVKVVTEKAKPWSVLATESDLTKQKQAARALAYLAQSWAVGRTPLEEVDMRICGIFHRQALVNSTAAFEQWENLIGIPLKQLAAYHKSGIRSEHVANLIHAAGLTAIAIGVN